MRDVRKTHAEVRVVSPTRTSNFTALEGAPRCTSPSCSSPLA